MLCVVYRALKTDIEFKALLTDRDDIDVIS